MGKLGNAIKILGLGAAILSSVLFYNESSPDFSQKNEPRTVYVSTYYPLIEPVDGNPLPYSEDYEGIDVYSVIDNVNPEAYDQIREIFNSAMENYLSDLNQEYVNVLENRASNPDGKKTFYEIQYFVYHTDQGREILYDILGEATVVQNNLVTGEDMWDYFVSTENFEEDLRELADEYFEYAILDSLDENAFKSIWAFELDDYLTYVDIDGLGDISYSDFYKGHSSGGLETYITTSQSLAEYNFNNLSESEALLTNLIRAVVCAVPGLTIYGIAYAFLNEKRKAESQDEGKSCSDISKIISGAMYSIAYALLNERRKAKRHDKSKPDICKIYDEMPDDAIIITPQKVSSSDIISRIMPEGEMPTEDERAALKRFLQQLDAK